MTNVWRKQGDKWLLFVTDLNAKEGDEVHVHKKSGEVQTIRLGTPVRLDGTFHLFEPAKKASTVLVPVTQPNVTIDLKNINNLFDKAKIHLKHPKVSLGLPGDHRGLRISLAGPRSGHPGAINLTSVAASTAQNNAWHRGYYQQHDWYGRVNTDGTLTLGKNAPAAMVTLLQDFAANPAKVAASHGHLTGSCCFCSKALTDERSTAVGYGAVCADHFDLPWGERPTEFAAAV
jgi:hypothetical protein